MVDLLHFRKRELKLVSCLRKTRVGQQLKQILFRSIAIEEERPQYRTSMDKQAGMIAKEQGGVNEWKIRGNIAKPTLQDPCWG